MDLDYWVEGVVEVLLEGDTVSLVDEVHDLFNIRYSS